MVADGVGLIFLRQHHCEPQPPLSAKHSALSVVLTCIPTLPIGDRQNAWITQVRDRMAASPPIEIRHGWIPL
jgi:hypothetical protein